MAEDRLSVSLLWNACSVRCAQAVPCFQSLVIGKGWVISGMIFGLVLQNRVRNCVGHARRQTYGAFLFNLLLLGVLLILFLIFIGS